MSLSVGWEWGFRGGGRIVGKTFEDGFCRLAACAGAVEAEFGGDLHDGLVADNVAFWELAYDARDVFFLHRAVLNLTGEFFGGFCVLADEHDATGQSVEAVAGERVPLVPAFCAHDFDNGVVVVTAGRVDGDASGLVDDDYVAVFVDDTNRLGSHGGFVAVEGMGDDVAVLDNGVDRDGLAIEYDFAALDGVLLEYIS